MKKALFFLLVVSISFSCKKKEEPEPEPVEVPVQKGTLNIQVLSYDSLGQLLTDGSGVRVLLNSNLSANTNTNGQVSFTELEFGNYFPSLLRENFEGAPSGVNLTAPVISHTLPCAQHSPFQASNFTSQIVTKDSIPVSFKLDRAIPGGKSVKVALLFSTSNDLHSGNYMSSDFFSVTTSTITNLNVAHFPNFKAKVNAVDSNSIFYIKVLPVSYGEYKSNLFSKPALLGENLYPPDHWLLTKNWK